MAAAQEFTEAGGPCSHQPSPQASRRLLSRRASVGAPGRCEVTLTQWRVPPSEHRGHHTEPVGIPMRALTGFPLRSVDSFLTRRPAPCSSILPPLSSVLTLGKGLSVPPALVRGHFDTLVEVLLSHGHWGAAGIPPVPQQALPPGNTAVTQPTGCHPGSQPPL